MTKEEANGKFTILNDEGKEIECEVLFTFDSEETNKSYIVYTDNTLDEEGNTKVYASVFDPTGKVKELQPLTSEKEWKVIETILGELQEEIAKADSSDRKAGEVGEEIDSTSQGTKACEEKIFERAESLKEGVRKREPFSLINMALLWALNVGDADSWDLADQLMMLVPKENVSGALSWWAKAAEDGDTEGYLVHLWLLRHNKILMSPLGTKEELFLRVKKEIKNLPDFFE